MGKVFHYVVKVNGREYDVEIESENEEVVVRNISRTSPSVTGNEVKTEPSRISEEPSTREERSAISEPSPKMSSPVAKEGTVVEAPLPGKILRINVRAGDAVKRGDVVLILEAMKMENEILAPTDGTVESILVNPGQTVNTHDTLVVLK